jgi:uncharacterized protein
MNIAASPAPLAEHELEHLEQLLSEPPLAGAALSADALQGMFVAMAMGPDDVPAARWLEAALGDDPDERPVPASEELVDLMTRFREDTARRVRDGSLSLLLYPLRRGRPDYTTWCRGFLAGVELSEAGWYDAADPEEMEELLFPIFVLADELTPEERASYTPAAWRKLVLDAEAGLDATLLRLRDYWAIVRAPPLTVRHEGPRVGRNDPCPCGSGRKFKQCCGR